MEEKKKRTTEWSFSFDKLGENISEFVKSVGVKGEEEIKTAEFSEPLGAAQRARVRLEPAVGRTTINTLSNDNLIEAELRYVGEVKFEVSGADDDKFISLSQVNGASEWFRNVFGWIGTGQKLYWNIGLSTRIPMDLEVRTGVGKSELNLSGLQTTSLRVRGGAGESTIILPAPSARYHAQIDTGVGETNLVIAAGALVDLDFSLGTGEVNMEIGANADVVATVRGGVGAFNLTIPADAAVRIEAQQGVGAINIPAHIIRTSGGGSWNRSGTFQTDDFETAARKITLRYQGGVGAFNVHLARRG